MKKIQSQSIEMFRKLIFTEHLFFEYEFVCCYL